MKVSIVTPSFNQGKFIERTLQSVAEQSGAEIEHVVFDGGSTDNTLDILKSFSPIVRWVSQRDKGQTDAVNKGICATNGDIIGWLNSDDIYYPNAINKIVKYFESNPDVEVVYGMADHIDINDFPFEPYPTEIWDFERLKKTCFICQPAVFFRRQVVEKYGLLDESLNYCMDYEYWLRLAYHGVNFAYLEVKLAGSRLYPETKTMSAKIRVCEEANDIFKKFMGKVPDNWLFLYASTSVEQHFSKYRFSIIKYSLITAYAIYAALKWNGNITLTMFHSIYFNFRKKIFC